MRAIVIALMLAAAAASPAFAGHHRVCHDHSRIVGRQDCAQYGSWTHSTSSGFFGHDLALAFERIGTPTFVQNGTLYNANGGSTGYHIQLAPGAPAKTTLFGPRLHAGYDGEYLSLGFEFEYATTLGNGPTAVLQVDGQPPTTSSGASLIDMGFRVGVHARPIDEISLGAELAVGLRDVEMDTPMVAAGYTSCAGGVSGKGCDPYLLDDQLLLEARVRADVFVTPRVSIGVAAGVDLAASGESIALHLTWHATAYDGS